MLKVEELDLLFYWYLISPSLEKVADVDDVGHNGNYLVLFF
jgi:hypothetical protein